MQTFLPYDNFSHSAAALDRQRLGKQRVEAYQILRTLTGVSSGWRNHPAVKMWRGHEGALAHYGWVMCDEWLRRGYKDSLITKFLIGRPIVMPPWFGDARIHVSHQSNLLRKMPEHYSGMFYDVPDDLPYYWPV